MTPWEILVEVRKIGWDIILGNDSLHIKPKGKTNLCEVEEINKLEPLVIEEKFSIRAILISERITSCLSAILTDKASTFKTLQFGEKEGYCELTLHVKHGEVGSVWKHRKRIEEFTGEIIGLPVEFSCKEVEE